MRGHELIEQMTKEASKRGMLGAEVKALDSSGEPFDIKGVEAEEQPDGSHILWLKMEWEG